MRRWSQKSEITTGRFIQWLGVAPSKFYRWRKRYGCLNEHNGWAPRDHWLEPWEKQAIVDFHLKNSSQGYRRLTYMMLDADIAAVSPSSVWRVLHRAGLLRQWNGKESKKGRGFQQPPEPHQHWHIDVSYINGNSGFVVGERGFGPATALDTVDAPILKPSAFGRGWDLGACVNGGVEGRAGDAPLPPKWLITMGLRQKNRFNECKACGCEPASNHMSGFGFSATDSDSGRRAHGSHERARSARKGRKKHVSVLPRPNRSPWIVVEQNHNGIGKLMVPAFQIYANMNVINDL